MATELCNQNDTNTSATAPGNTHVLTTENRPGNTIVHANLMPMLETCLSTNRFSRGEREGRIVRNFSEGDGDGNSPDQLHCNSADLVMTKCRAKMWGDGITDPFTQARIENQKNRWDSCCGTTNLVQTGNKMGPTSRDGTETHTLTTSGPSTNNAIFGNPGLIISNIPFESLQPLG
uniref:SET domain-containing protein n=3 Tax=Mesocestoides corti TaxID=53468 RepID=A0A5K3FMT9_MESCO